MEGPRYRQTGAQQALSARYQHWLSSLLDLFAAADIHPVFCFSAARDINTQLEMFNIKEFTFVRRRVGLRD